MVFKNKKVAGLRHVCFDSGHKNTIMRSLAHDKTIQK